MREARRYFAHRLRARSIQTHVMHLDICEMGKTLHRAPKEKIPQEPQAHTHSLSGAIRKSS